MQDQISWYSQQELDDVEIIFFYKNIYVPLTLCRRVLYWYHFYLNHPSVIRYSNIIRQVCYWKGLLSQVEISVKMGKKFQQFKKRNTLSGQIPPKIIAALKPWNSVHIDLIGPYSKSIIKHHPDGTIIKKYYSLNCMKINDTTTGSFEIVEVPPALHHTFLVTYALRHRCPCIFSQVMAWFHLNHP